MGNLNILARNIIMLSVNHIGKRETAKIYGIPHIVIDQYILDIDQGTLTAREIIRLDMAKKLAEKKGIKAWKASEKDKYKGGRLQ